MKHKMFGRSQNKTGKPPGTLIYTGHRQQEQLRISSFSYDEQEYSEQEVPQIEDVFPLRDSQRTAWINIDGLHAVDQIEKLGGHFGIHSLLLEDILNTNQRPKMEDMGDYLCIILKMIDFDEKNGDLDSEQVSIILGKEYVISFQERRGDVFESIRERIRKGGGRIRRMKADYLAYCLVDAIVDHYFVALERVGEQLETLEERVMEDPDSGALQSLYDLKRQLLNLRKSVWPVREIANRLDRSESALIGQKIKIYLRDIYDHTIQVIDMLETLRDMHTGLFDMYLSNVSNKMNEVMKTLTIIATIFIPLTFVAGIYGMNFQHMPELTWRYGYFAVLGLMAGLFIGMMIFFKKKKWL